MSVFLAGRVAETCSISTSARAFAQPPSVKANTNYRDIKNPTNTHLMRLICGMYFWINLFAILPYGEIGVRTHVLHAPYIIAGCNVVLFSLDMLEPDDVPSERYYCLPIYQTDWHDSLIKPVPQAHCALRCAFDSICI